MIIRLHGAVHQVPLHLHGGQGGGGVALAQANTEGTKRYSKGSHNLQIRISKFIL